MKMSSTTKTVLKILLALTLLPFASFLLLFAGAKAKNRNLMVEGAVYATIFVVSVYLPSGSAIGAILFLGSIAASAARSVQVRDLWLKKPTPQPQLQPASVYGTPPVAQFPPQVLGTPYPPQPVAAPFPAAPITSTTTVNDDLLSALAWVVSRAKQNRHRLPADAYVTILECCQTLNSVEDAEKQLPSVDTEFQYELEAMVREYLPSVLKNYLAIPASMVNDPQANGRTPVEELSEQLQLLNRQAETLHASRHGHASAELTNTGNFLREKFGHQAAKFDFGIE
ncbi:MAG TPA: hypothetical protein VFC82_04650 [Actinomycetaceae bacterium]|nr:hypothetical protein [Actinomycetaceae bacterium]